jgi:GNAT superfamily N-acetyltransferase
VIELREAGSAVELQQLRGLFREYQRWVDEPCCFAGFEKELAGLPGDYAPPQGRLWLAFVDGAPAGCVALRPLDQGRCEMKRLYVRPAFRGLGLGKRLAQAVIEAARAGGCRTLLLDTLPKMRSAIALYAALGFAPRAAYCAQPTPGALFFERPL